jgi:exocyst complex component 2
LKFFEISSHLDSSVFDAYIQEKSSRLDDIIKKGILYSGYDWKVKLKPNCIQGYVNESLLFLILTHSEIHSIVGLVSSSVPRRIFNCLLSVMLHSFLFAIRQIPYFGDGGATQALVRI